MTSAALLQPFDLLKTRVQQPDRPGLLAALRSIRSPSSPADSAEPNARPRPRILALWRGTLPSVLRTGFGSALYFTSLNALRQHLSRQQGPSPSSSTSGARDKGQLHHHSSSLPQLPLTNNLVAGAAARAFAGFVLMPLTVIKVRYESSLYNYRSLASAAADIHAGSGGGAAGLRGFFAGFGATAVRDAPGAGLYVVLYEVLKSRLSRIAHVPSTDDKDDTRSQRKAGGSMTMHPTAARTVNFAAATLAGAAVSAASNPFDAVKTRIQLRPGEYANTWHAARRMAAEEGWRAFASGLGLRMARKALSSALAWTLYEELVRRAEGVWGGPGAARRKGEIVV